MVKEISIAGLEATRVAHAITILTEMAAAMEPHYAAHRTDFGHAFAGVPRERDTNMFLIPTTLILY